MFRSLSNTISKLGEHVCSSADDGSQILTTYVADTQFNWDQHYNLFPLHYLLMRSAAKGRKDILQVLKEWINNPTIKWFDKYHYFDEHFNHPAEVPHTTAQWLAIAAANGYQEAQEVLTTLMLSHQEDCYKAVFFVVFKYKEITDAQISTLLQFLLDNKNFDWDYIIGCEYSFLYFILCHVQYAQHDKRYHFAIKILLDREGLNLNQEMPHRNHKGSTALLRLMTHLFLETNLDLDHLERYVTDPSSNFNATVTAKSKMQGETPIYWYACSLQCDTKAVQVLPKMVERKDVDWLITSTGGSRKIGTNALYFLLKEASKSTEIKKSAHVVLDRLFLTKKDFQKVLDTMYQHPNCINEAKNAMGIIQENRAAHALNTVPSLNHDNEEQNTTKESPLTPTEISIENDTTSCFNNAHKYKYRVKDLINGQLIDFTTVLDQKYINCLVLRAYDSRVFVTSDSLEVCYDIMDRPFQTHKPQELYISALKLRLESLNSKRPEHVISYVKDGVELCYHTIIELIETHQDAIMALGVEQRLTLAEHIELIKYPTVDCYGVLLKTNNTNEPYIRLDIPEKSIYKPITELKSAGKDIPEILLESRALDLLERINNLLPKGNGPHPTMQHLSGCDLGPYYDYMLHSPSVITQLLSGKSFRIIKSPDSKRFMTMNVIRTSKGDYILILDPKSKDIRGIKDPQYKPLYRRAEDEDNVKRCWRIDVNPPEKWVNKVGFTNIGRNSALTAQRESDISHIVFTTVDSAIKSGQLTFDHIDTPIIETHLGVLHGKNGTYKMSQYMQKRGSTLYDALNLLTPKDHNRIIDILLKTVACLHEKGIIHQDIKCTNIMIFVHNGVYYPYLADFGTTIVPGMKKNPNVTGTPGYISPEILFAFKNNSKLSWGREDYFIKDDSYAKKLLETLNPYTKEEAADYDKPHKANDIWSLGIVIFKILYKRDPKYPADILLIKNHPLLSQLLEVDRHKRSDLKKAIQIAQDSLQPHPIPVRQQQQETIGLGFPFNLFSKCRAITEIELCDLSRRQPYNG